MTTVAEAIAAIVDRPKPAPKYATRAKKFRASFAWRRLRYRILSENAKHNGGAARCELCGRSRADGVILHVDHIVPLSKDWSRRLDPSNMQVLCADDNGGKSNRDDFDFRPADAQASKTQHAKEIA
jgi:5-methylcytosine-specific restriction endonuclease McrA